jgi:Carboxypeptidase regulatory-like domain
MPNSGVTDDYDVRTRLSKVATRCVQIAAIFLTAVTSFVSSGSAQVAVVEVRVGQFPSCVDTENQLVTSLSRQVLGPDAKPIPSVQVSVENAAGTNVFVTRSDRKGKYVVRGLKPGDYRVALKASGYMRYEYTLIVLRARHAETSVVRLRSNAECNDRASDEEVEVFPVDAAEHCRRVEHIEPNLHVSRVAQLLGRIFDESGAPFPNSRVELRRYASEAEQVSIKSVTTDSEGSFDLGIIPVDEYRLLASPTRAFRQPGEMWCRTEGTCSLEITLKANPSDMLDSQCPIR